MASLIARRMIQFVIVAWVLATVLFFAMRISGDPAALILGEDATVEQIELIRSKLGLNRPLHVQYFDFILGLLPRYTGGEWQVLDFGKSLHNPVPAIDLVLKRLPATLALGAVAMGFVAFISIPLGAAAAWYQGRPAGAFIVFLSLIGQTVPNFVLALSFIMIFGVVWRVFPVFGFPGPNALVLPAISLAAYPLARQVRLLRSQMLEVAVQDYIRTARAKGLTEPSVVIRHQLRNALLPWLTMLGLDVSFLLGGSIIVETVFAWPGIGSQLISAINLRDYPIVQAIIFIVGLMVVMGNLITDILYRWLDPRIRYVG